VIRILQFLCVECTATWRVLPRFLARHLWHPWRVVERSEPGRAETPPISERTKARWAARLASSLAAICAELSCRLVHAGKRDAEAKGVIERWHRTWREEVEDELEGDVIELEYLSAAHAAWLAREYHLRVHRAAPAPDPLALSLRADDDVHLELIDAATSPADSDDPPADGALDRAVLAALARRLLLA
jgi:hypothetical protein